MTRESIRTRRNRPSAGGPFAPPRHRGTPPRSPWIIAGALVASVTLGARDARAIDFRALLRTGDERRSQIAVAPRAYTAAATGTSQQDQPVRRFDIPAGTLESVLSAFTKATGMKVQTPTADGVGSIYSPGVTGTLTLEQALEQLLAGTSLTFRVVAADAAIIAFRTQGESVDVTARAPVVLGSPKYTAPLVDTPQSIEVISSRVMADQGVTTLREAVRNVAGLSLAAGEGGSQGDNLTIRGFSARSDIFMDGMRDFGSYYRDPFNQEEVQVLKGPSSVTFGRGSTGGVVNQASKTPRLTPSIGGTVTAGTDRTRRVTVDIDRPVPELGDGAAVRLNVMAHDARVAGRDSAESRRFGIAPSLALGLGTPTRTTLSYFHQSGNDTPDYGIPWLFDRPAPVDRSNYYGFAASNFLRTNADVATLRIEHDFGARLTVTNQVRYANYSRDAQITEAKIAEDVTPSTPLDAITVNRGQIAVSSMESFVQNQLDATARFHSGAIGHTLVAGFELGRETSNPSRPRFSGVPSTSLLEPDAQQPFSGSSSITSSVRAAAVGAGAYVLDTIALGDQWDLVGGLRWDRFDASYEQRVAPVSAFDRQDDMTSWRAAIVYKPAPFGSVYANAGTSFNPSAESLSLSARTANTPPETNRTYEVGSKWDLPGRLSLRSSIFRTEKTNAREPDPENPLQNVLSGEQRVNGMEVEATGHLTDGWELVSSYAFMDAKLVKSAAYPDAVGGTLANAPRHTLNVWSTFELPWRLEAGGGARYVGRRTASTTSPIDPTTGVVKSLPGYWTGSAMVRRPLTPRLDLQLNIENITDEYFFDQLHPGHIVPGAGRSALLGFNFKF